MVIIWHQPKQWLLFTRNLSWFTIHLHSLRFHQSFANFMTPVQNGLRNFLCCNFCATGHRYTPEALSHVYNTTRTLAIVLLKPLMPANVSIYERICLQLTAFWGKCNEIPRTLHPLNVKGSQVLNFAEVVLIHAMREVKKEVILTGDFKPDATSYTSSWRWWW